MLKTISLSLKRQPSPISDFEDFFGNLDQNSETQNDQPKQKFLSNKRQKKQAMKINSILNSTTDDNCLSLLAPKYGASNNENIFDQERSI